jgi:ribosomal protein L11 methyltransferase
MNYFEVKFTCNPYSEVAGDLLAAGLAEIGFESFVESENGTIAYIQESLFNEELIKEQIGSFPLPVAVSYSFEKIEDKDWNEEWEKNYFKPLVIDDRCIVQSTFHNEPAIYEYNIVIDPKMAFGTGHHQTTELVIREMLNYDFKSKEVLDMGCGTAILAILASMRGADKVMAIDIDKWAYDNAIENLELNNIKNTEVQIGGADLLGTESYDVILANINRNILLNDIKVYASVLRKEGDLFMSGFYVEDIPAIQEECSKYGLKFVSYSSKDNLAVVRFVNS